MNPEASFDDRDDDAPNETTRPQEETT